MFTQSIRFKIILWYMLILFLTLSFFSIFLYQYYSRQYYSNIDEILISRAEGIIDSIETYWETEKIEAEKDGITGNILTKANNINFKRIAQRWFEEKSEDPDLANLVIRVFDSNGAMIASSKGLNIPEELSERTLKALFAGKGRFENIEQIKNPAKKTPETILRTYIIPVLEGKNPGYIVQVGSYFAGRGSAMNNLRIILFILLPITVILTGIAGSFLAKITLKPVDDMIQTIHGITAENLKMRVNVPKTNDEIKRLADTFNQMLVKLETAFTTQKEFVQDMSHELKTPIAVMKGEMEVILKKERRAGDYKKVLKSALEEIDKINRVVENLLVLARFDSREVKLEMKELDLNEVIKKAVSDMKIIAAKGRIKMKLKRSGPAKIIGDEKQLSRLFLNIIDNAVKYNKRSGSVELSIGSFEGFWKVSIKDTGAGITEKDLARIFDRFYRSENREEGVGFGLGLAIVKTIVEAHKGEVLVKSAVNKGSTFTIKLPSVQ